MNKDLAEATLKGAGYMQITKIEADDGHREGEGIKAAGKQYIGGDLGHCQRELGLFVAVSCVERVSEFLQNLTLKA